VQGLSGNPLDFEQNGPETIRAAGDGCLLAPEPGTENKLTNIGPVPLAAATMKSLFFMIISYNSKPNRFRTSSNILLYSQLISEPLFGFHI